LTKFTPGNTDGRDESNAVVCETHQTRCFNLHTHKHMLLFPLLTIDSFMNRCEPNPWNSAKGRHLARHGSIPLQEQWFLLFILY